MRKRVLAGLPYGPIPSTRQSSITTSKPFDIENGYHLLWSRCQAFSPSTGRLLSIRTLLLEQTARLMATINSDSDQITALAPPPNGGAVPQQAGALSRRKLLGLTGRALYLSPTITLLTIAPSGAAGQSGCGSGPLPCPPSPPTPRAGP